MGKRIGDEIEAKAAKAESLISSVQEEIDKIYGHERIDKNLQDAFKVLGIKQTNDIKAVRNAYIKQAKIWHPDISKRKNSQETMKAINEAYYRILASHGKLGLRNEPMPIADIERRLIIRYSAAKEHDYAYFLNALNNAVTRNDVLGLIGVLADWEGRLERARAEMLKSLKAKKVKLLLYRRWFERMQNESMAKSELKSIDACVAGIDDVFKSVDTAFRDVASIIGPAERRQIDKLYSSLS